MEEVERKMRKVIQKEIKERLEIENKEGRKVWRKDVKN